ncbi:uncharacterized protein LOC114915054 [Cajanus cajan]|uniref:uncharacterized protein LOC114915054 n=1 Tax=Cajanus cajan TaxID=3821 RepID=UPI0010FB59E6|nr:uncharacterized protein LOC114915054 [Cajanus cajan]XP_029124899.1 uncharacterized protein LOC114915054 [Cajanus cajan]XP_029124900.1 uncharacterized protein LOC114915054 [Cajanus cajan]
MEGQVVAAEVAERMRVEEVKEALGHKAKAKEEATTALRDLRKECEDQIVHEHEAGFMHVVRQATYLYRVPFDFTFKVTKDFYKGTYMDFTKIPEDVEPDDVAPARSSSGEDPGTTC